MQNCELWFAIVERFGAVFGQPLPKEVLAIGSAQRGWCVQLNATGEDRYLLPKFSVSVSWNGCPAGVIDASGGLIAAGGLANEHTFREWLPIAERNVDSVPA